jgi:pilus assembly protein Flp/PilA
VIRTLGRTGTEIDRRNYNIIQKTGGKEMKKLINWLKKEESGQGMVEYGLIIAGIAIVVMVVIFTLGDQIAALFNQVVGQLGGGAAG